MSARDYWDRMLVYFGIAAEEYEDEDAAWERQQPESQHRTTSSSDRRSRARESYADEPRGAGAAHHHPQPRSAPPRRAPGASRTRPPSQHVAGVGVVPPRTFNDAQQIADQFKRGNPVIVNLQTCDGDLAKRIIDFASGLTYGLDGAMARIAEKVFLLTPPDVDVSAEDRAAIAESSFFNQS